jgi:hypothetical protein
MDKKMAPKKGMKAIGKFKIAHPTKKMEDMSGERKESYVFGGLRKTGIKKYGEEGFKTRTMKGMKKGK